MNNNIKILIVEDEAITSMYIKMHLKNLGYAQSEIISSGEDAVRIFNSYKPDLIIMDINLSGIINGIDAARLIRAKSKVPVIFITGYSDSEIRKNAADLNPEAYLIKPVNEEDLNTAMHKALG